MAGYRVELNSTHDMGRWHGRAVGRVVVRLTSDMLTASAAVEYQLDSSRSICIAPLCHQTTTLFMQRHQQYQKVTRVGVAE